MARVWDDSQARGTGLLVMLAIANYAKADGSGAWPAIGTLARDCRLSVRAIQDIIRRLDAAGELRVERGAGPSGVNLYTVTPGAGAGSAGGAESAGAEVQILHRGGADLRTPSVRKSAPYPLVNHHRSYTQQGARVSVAEMTHAECRVAAMVRAVPGAANIGDGEIVGHLRDVISALPSSPDDDALVADALRFRDYWADKRAGKSGPWKSWRTSMTNWFSRTQSTRLPPPGARGSSTAPDFSGINQVADAIRAQERGASR